METVVGSFKRISPGELFELRDLYRVDWPKSAFTFYTLENFVRWRAWFHNDEVQLYVEQDWTNSGTFVAKDHNELFFDTRLETTDGLRSLLTAVIHFCGPNISVVCSSRFREVLMMITNDLSYRLINDDRMICYRQTVPLQTNDKCGLPDGYLYAPLRADVIDQVSQEWVHNDQMFVNLPGRLIQRNPSLGVYDEKDQLVGWCLIDQTGSLALFQTMPSHRRRGLGRLLIDRFSRLLHRKGVLPQALIVQSNQASRSLFEKLEFKQVDHWCWARFKRQEITCLNDETPSA